MRMSDQDNKPSTARFFKVIEVYKKSISAASPGSVDDYEENKENKFVIVQIDTNGAQSVASTTTDANQQKAKIAAKAAEEAAASPLVPVGAPTPPAAPVAPAEEVGWGMQHNFTLNLNGNKAAPAGAVSPLLLQTPPAAAASVAPAAELKGGRRTKKNRKRKH